MGSGSDLADWDGTPGAARVLTTGASLAALCIITFCLSEYNFRSDVAAHGLNFQARRIQAIKNWRKIPLPRCRTRPH